VRHPDRSHRRLQQARQNNKSLNAWRAILSKSWFCGFPGPQGSSGNGGVAGLIRTWKEKHPIDSPG
jgi:hypothetical protein